MIFPTRADTRARGCFFRTLVRPSPPRWKQNYRSYRKVQFIGQLKARRIVLCLDTQAGVYDTGFGTVFSAARTARTMVPSGTPSSLAIARKLFPSALNSIARSRRNTRGGRPIGKSFPDRVWRSFPMRPNRRFARCCRIPARTRSIMSERSYSANAPIMCSSNFPTGERLSVSMPWFGAQNRIPRASSVWMVSIRPRRERPKRSSFQTRTTSNRFSRAPPVSAQLLYAAYTKLGLPSRTLDSKIKRLKINVYRFKTPG